MLIPTWVSWKELQVHLIFFNQQSIWKQGTNPFPEAISTEKSRNTKASDYPFQLLQDVVFIYRYMSISTPVKKGTQWTNP